MAEVNEVGKAGKLGKDHWVTQDDHLDFEWVLLVLEARRLGCTPDEIRAFIATAPCATPDLN